MVIFIYQYGGLTLRYARWPRLAALGLPPVNAIVEPFRERKSHP